MTTTLNPRHLKRRPGMAAALRPVLTTKGTVAVGGVVVAAAAVSGVALAAPALAAPASSNVVTLQAGSTGSLVKVVQQRLGGLAVDGVFGAQTTSAVKALQGRKGLVRDGVVGPLTWVALGGFPGSSVAPPPPPPPPTCMVKVLRYGSSGSLVVALQRRVGVAADGEFGPVTLGAVKSFQSREGVTADARGIVGAATWRALGGMPCGVTPAPPAGGGGGSTSTDAKVALVVGIAKQYLGVPYLWGGSTPSGFDCSGLTQYSYSHAGLSIPRTAAQQQAYMKKTTSPVPGDLVFFGAPAYHVAIYVSPGMMLASPVPGQFVRIEKIWATPTNYGTLR